MDKKMNLGQIRLFVADRVTPLFEKVIETKQDKVIGLHVIGSAITDDFDQDRSDINTLVVLNEMDLDFLDTAATLCHKYGDGRLGSPWLMTPQFIERMAETSPVELLDLKLVNKLVWGSDVVSGVDIPKSSIRVQCKRELRNRLIKLGWGYVRVGSGKNDMADLLDESVSGLAALMRAILYMKGETPPLTSALLLEALAPLVGPSALSFKEVHWMKTRGQKMPVPRMRAALKDYYRAIEKLIEVVDKIES